MLNVPSGFHSEINFKLSRQCGGGGSKESVISQAQQKINRNNYEEQLWRLSLCALGILQGNVIPVEQSLATRMHTPVSDVNANEQTSVSTVPVIPMQTPSTKAGSVVTNYKKPYALTRRSFNTPTILVKHGHKVQRVMVSSTTPNTMYNGQVLSPR